MTGIKALGRWHEYRGHAQNTKFYEEVVNIALNATFKVAYSSDISLNGNVNANGNYWCPLTTNGNGNYELLQNGN